jgi:hypothetical protein
MMARDHNLTVLKRGDLVRKFNPERNPQIDNPEYNKIYAIVSIKGLFINLIDPTNPSEETRLASSMVVKVDKFTR